MHVVTDAACVPHAWKQTNSGPASALPKEKHVLTCILLEKSLIA